MKNPVWLVLYESDGSSCAIDPSCMGSVDAAVSLWTDSNYTRDTLLDISFITGEVYRVLASRITSWYLSTPEHRENTVQFENECKEEQKETKAALGIFES